MRIRFSDLCLGFVLCSLPVLAVLQSCNSGGPIAPGSAGDEPPEDNRAPVAMITMLNDEEGPSPFTAKLDAVGTYDPDGDSMTFTWIFSDGTSETGPYVEHQFTSGGRWDARLVVTDKWGAAGSAGPVNFSSWGLANSAWPKFAHDEKNTGLSPNVGPMMNMENADTGGAFPRYWRSDNQDNVVNAVCVGYDGNVLYAQGPWLRYRTPDGATIWDYRAPMKITAWPAIAYDGSIIIGDESSNVIRVSADGEMMWSTRITDEIDLFIYLDSAVNIGGNRVIYVCGADLFGQVPYDQAGRLLALSFDGELLWQRPFQAGPWGRGRLITPVITPDGNIVVNGANAIIFSPDGTELSRSEYLYKSTPQYLGPPAVLPNGFVAFTHGRLPVFDSNGIFQSELMGDAMCGDNVGDYYAGWRQAPLVGQISISQIQLTSADNLNPSFTIGTLGGALLRLPIKSSYPYGDQNYIAGAAQDSLGRAYVSCRGIHAYGDITVSSIYPYAPARYSMWSYVRQTGHMTPPAIGEDGWMYLGYGNDIMALGD